jgi:hypothetical protein
MTRSRAKVPAAVYAAIVLMRLGAALAIASVVSFALQRSEFRDHVAARTGDASGAAKVLDVVVVGVAIAGLVCAGLWIWMAVMNAKGRNWARIVATVFGALYISSGVLAFALNGSYVTAEVNNVRLDLSMQNALLLCSVLIAVPALVLMWVSSSSRWYEPRVPAPPAPATIVSH